MKDSTKKSIQETSELIMITLKQFEVAGFAASRDQLVITHPIPALAESSCMMY